MNEVFVFIFFLNKVMRFFFRYDMLDFFLTIMTTTIDNHYLPYLDKWISHFVGGCWKSRQHVTSSSEGPFPHHIMMNDSIVVEMCQEGNATERQEMTVI